MKILVRSFLITLVILSCQIEDNDAPVPNDVFIKYHGTIGSQTATDLEIVYAQDSAVDGFLLFGTQEVDSAGDISDDFYFVRTDADGNELGQNTLGFGYRPEISLSPNNKPYYWQEISTGNLLLLEQMLFLGHDTSAINNPLFERKDFDPDNDGLENDPDSVDIVLTQEIAGQIKSTEFGIFYVGTSSLSWQAIDPDLDNRTTTLMTFGSLNDALDVVTINQAAILSIGLDLEGNDMLVTADAENDELVVVFAGAYNNGSDRDFYYAKYTLNVSGTDTTLVENWSFIADNGSLAGTDDVMVRVLENEAGNYVLFGYGEHTGNNGETGTNIYIQEIDPNTGNIVNNKRNGVIITPNAGNDNSSTDDFINNVIPISTGYAIVGTSEITSVNKRGFFMVIKDFLEIDDNVNDTLGIRLNAEGTTLTDVQTEAFGITQTARRDFVVVGRFPSLTVGGVNRNDDILLTRVDASGKVSNTMTRNYGIGDGNDWAADVVTLPDGKIVMLGTIDFGGGITLLSLIKLNDDGSLDE